MDQLSRSPAESTQSLDAVPLSLPMSLPEEQRFRELTARWRKDTAFLSSTSEIATHPAYQQLIGMGPAALPFIFAELRKRPALWFWALRSITGEDPVPTTARGNLGQMTAAWLHWASQHGY